MYTKFHERVNSSLTSVCSQELPNCGAFFKAGVDIIELSPEEDCVQQSLFTGDAAICINGTALITRPSKRGSRLPEVSDVLADDIWISVGSS